MMWSVLIAGVAHARLFTAPAANVASPNTFVSMDMNNAASPLLQPQVIVPVQVPQRSVSDGTAAALGVALLAAGLGVVAGRQAVLFSSGKSSPGPKKTAGKPAGKSRVGVENLAAGGSRDQSLYANRKNIQTQRNGFGSFVQKFQLATGKSKYGVPIFLPNGNVNPAYLAAERKDIQAKSRLNTKAAEQKRVGLIKKKQFELADYVRKAIGPVGSGKDYYQSGR